MVTCYSRHRKLILTLFRNMFLETYNQITWMIKETKGKELPAPSALHPCRPSEHPHSSFPAGHGRCITSLSALWGGHHRGSQRSGLAWVLFQGLLRPSSQPQACICCPAQSSAGGCVQLQVGVLATSCLHPTLWATRAGSGVQGGAW